MISNITAAFARLKEEGLKLVGIGPEGEEASSTLTFPLHSRSLQTSMKEPYPWCWVWSGQ